MPEATNSKYPLVFLRCRTVAFSAIAFSSFLWSVLICVIVYVQWDAMYRPQQSFVLTMLAIDTMTCVMLLVLLVQTFKAWLDAARIFFLFIAQLGVAAAFAHWSPKFTCPRPSPDDQAVCRLVILYLLFASWILPALILLYAGGLAIMVFHRRRQSLKGPTLTGDMEGFSLEKKHGLHMSQQSSFLLPLPSPSSATPTPIKSVFAIPYAPPPNRLSAIPTPTSATFSTYGATSSTNHTPTSPTFTDPTNIYAIPPLPHHWNSSPPPRSRKYSTTLSESILEEHAGSSDSDLDMRTSARLSKPSRSSRLPSL